MGIFTSCLPRQSSTLQAMRFWYQVLHHHLSALRFQLLTLQQQPPRTCLEPFSFAMDQRSKPIALRDCGARFGSTSLWLSSRFSYVEKKSLACAVLPARTADIPRTIGAGLAEMGFTLESFTSSFSILRYSCGWGRLVCVMARFSHSVRRRRSPHSACTIDEA